MALRGTFHGVSIDGAKLARVMSSPNGPAMRQAIIAAERVEERAKELVGYDDSPDRDAGRPHLRDTIVKRLTDSGGAGVTVQVGSESPIAVFHHEGTEPHMIHGDPLLVFFWPKAGRVVAFPRVNHPGTRPNRFLTNALDALPPGWHVRR
jgi:hypothetical protein